MVESTKHREHSSLYAEKRKTKCGNFLNNVIVYIYDSNNRKGSTHIEVTAFNISFQYLSTLTLKVEGVHSTPP